MQPLTIHILQYNIAWQNVQANLATIENYLPQVQKDSILVLPECFATGFCVSNPSIAQAMDGEIVQWMCRHALDKVICGSVFIKQEDKIYNTFIWAQNGQVKYSYNKKHLFGLGSESEHFSAGEQQLKIAYMGYTIQPFICYDLRFPVWNRNTPPYADIYIYVANWPAVRHQAWQKLLQARAIENQVFVIACNRIGTDGNEMDHAGGSSIIEYTGKVLCEANNNELITYNVHKTQLDAFRANFPFLADSDPFQFQ